MRCDVTRRDSHHITSHHASPAAAAGGGINLPPPPGLVPPPCCSAGIIHPQSDTVCSRPAFTAAGQAPSPPQRHTVTGARCPAANSPMCQVPGAAPLSAHALAGPCGSPPPLLPCMHACTRAVLPQRAHAVAPERECTRHLPFGARVGRERAYCAVPPAASKLRGLSVKGMCARPSGSRVAEASASAAEYPGFRAGGLEPWLPRERSNWAPLTAVQNGRLL